MNIRQRTAFSTITLTLALGVSVVHAQGKIYWTEFGAIRRANLDGSNIEDLVTTELTNTYGIALDAANGKMYWADVGIRKIQRADLDGANVEDLVSDVAAWGIALDVSGGKMYWTSSNPSKVQRANLDGSAVEDLVAGLMQPWGIALNLADGKMYWAGTYSNKIQRATLNGADVEDLVSTADAPYAIALDVNGGKMYWTSSGVDFQERPKIQRANFDGSDVEVLVPQDPDVYGFFGMAVDPGAGQMYWTIASPATIRRANLDGSGMEIVLDNMSGLPIGMALDIRRPPIPTLSEWGVVATTAFLLGTGAIIIRRRVGTHNQGADSGRFWKGSMVTRHGQLFAILASAFCTVPTSGAVTQLAPRTPLPKPATISKPPYESRLTVKFRDDLKVRADGGDLTSLVSADLGYDCIQTPTSDCCDVAGGVNWYGFHSKCEFIDCFEGPMGPQGL